MDDENRPLFAEWAERLRVCGFTVHSPPEISDGLTEQFLRVIPRPYKAGIREWMAEDLRLICLKTDAVLVLDRRAIHGPTVRSKGVDAEVAAAHAVGVPVLIVECRAPKGVAVADTSGQSGQGVQDPLQR